MNKKEIQNKKEIDEIENQIVEIITSSNEADKEIKKEGSQYLPENDPNLNILIPPNSL